VQLLRLSAFRFVAACALVAASCTVGTYRLVGRIAPSRDTAPHPGWHVITWGSGTATLLESLALLLGAASFVEIAVWASKRQIDFARCLLATGWALAGALTGVVVQIVSAPAWTPTYGHMAIIAVAASWSVAVAAARGLLRNRDSVNDQQSRGCPYCAVDAHLVAGDVQQVAVRDDQQTALLRCPRCRWLYEIQITGSPIQARRVSEGQALEEYAVCSQDRRPTSP
jgi:hypothetical protein